MNVFFAGGGTGGHLYPALAIARALVRANPAVTPFFVGARRGIELDVLPTTEFPFELLDLHPLYRSAPWNNWRTLLGATSAWRQLARIARNRPPAVLVATGGYASGVALAFASRSGIPIVIQEQNSFPGMTVRWFAPQATQIHLGFPEAEAFLRRGRFTTIFDSGNPIEPPPIPRPDQAAALAQWGLSNDGVKTLLVFGGSQGAAAINRVMSDWITSSGKKDIGVKVIWATGAREYPAYQHLQSDSVRISSYIAPMANAYAAADFTLCRAGAMTTAELSAWGLPAILIPLPSAAADHQTANARTIAAAGSAVMLPQNSLSVQTLAVTIQRFISDPSLLATMRDATSHRARPEAANDIVKHIFTIN